MNPTEFMCVGGARLHIQGGAGGGADVLVREGMSVGTQPDGRALPVSPRYQSKRSTRLNGTTEGP